jgi:hypothetical protein
MEHHEVNALWQAEMAPFFDLPKESVPIPDCSGSRRSFHLG